MHCKAMQPCSPDTAVWVAWLSCMSMATSDFMSCFTHAIMRSLAYHSRIAQRSHDDLWYWQRSTCASYELVPSHRWLPCTMSLQTCHTSTSQHLLSTCIEAKDIRLTDAMPKECQHTEGIPDEDMTSCKYLTVTLIASAISSLNSAMS